MLGLWIMGRMMTSLNSVRPLAATTACVAIVSFLLVVADKSHAQGRNPYGPIHLHDRNGDGKISPDEWPFRNFPIIDKNRDGFLTPDEFARLWGIPWSDQGGHARTDSGGHQDHKSTGRKDRSQVKIVEADGLRCAGGTRIRWIDTHAHVPGRGAREVNIPQAVRAAAHAMDQSGICRMVLMPVPGAHGNFDPQVLEDFLAEARKYPDRFVVMGGGGTLNSIIHDEAANGQVKKALKDRFAKRADTILKLGAIGFGEVGILHLAAYPGQQFENVPGDQPLFFVLSDIAAQHDVVIDVHFDLVMKEMATPKWLPQPPDPSRLKPNLTAFEHFLRHNPNAKVVWAHLGSDFVGFRTPELTLRMLNDHPNLYMSLRLGPGRVPSNHPMTANGIKPEWLRLFEDYPDRFVIGTDQIFSLDGGPLTKQHKMQREIVRNQTNRFLSYLPSKLARMIAFENAIRLYKIKM
jgi:hypothetical protein